MGENASTKELEPITCPNPKCQKKIEKPVLLDNLSSTPSEQYRACPHCFLKLDAISTYLPKKEVKGRSNHLPKQKSTVKKLKRKEKALSVCVHHFGYLPSRGKDAPIPQECLTCSKVLECITAIDS